MDEPAETRSTAASNGPRWGERAEDWADVAAGLAWPAWEAVADAARIAAGMRVLDVGCGSGEFCRLAADRGAEASGIDAAEGMIAVAQRAVPEGDFRKGPMERLPWPDEEFDLVTGFNSFPFAADVVGAVVEARRVARTGGQVAIANWGPPEGNELIAVITAVRPLQPPPPLDEPPGPRAYGEPGALKGLAHAAGLTVRRVEMVDVPFELPDQPTLERALLAPGGVRSAVHHAGEDAVRAAIVEAAAPFRRPDGSYAFRNRFNFVIAEAGPRVVK